jgi:hypothetical protein
MAQKQFCPTHEDFLAVRQGHSACRSVVKNSFTTAVKWRERYLEQAATGNVIEILEP